MKNSSYGLGYALIVIGVVLILHNFDLIQFNIRELVRFWPLLLVYAGLTLLGGNKKSLMINLAMLAITLLAVLAYYFFKMPDSFII
ncbi:MAG: hypothetical protein H6605_06280 [Flavobacteriales bacterium]|nr:hypothetical protein [Flavobacteriales bacterium]